MAGRRNRYGYQEYRGRGGGRSVLIFIVVLLAVLLIAGVVFMVVMGDHIKYTDTGLEIDWPWRHQEPTAPPEFSDPVVIETDPVVITMEPTSEPTLEPTPTPTPTPEPQYEPLAAVAVTADQLRYGTAAQAVASAGGSALVVEMKSANTGKLAWQSQTELAAALNANAANNGAADAIRGLAQEGSLYLIARVHCFKDPLLARAWVGPLLTRGGSMWHDYSGINWSSPASQQAADYLSALCLELADMGFDEILLDDAGYPWDGELFALATDDNRPEDRTVPVAAFLQRIAGELREKDVRLSVYVYEDLTNEEVYSGLTAAVLAQNTGRVWLDRRAVRENCENALYAAGLDNLSARVVAPVAGAAAGGSWYK